jgi:hypothetical protein
MKKLSLVSKLCLATVLAAGALSSAASSAEAVAQCPRQGIQCTDVYNPVICSNGQVYGNGCYAYIACATGCVPYGAV